MYTLHMSSRWYTSGIHHAPRLVSHHRRNWCQVSSASQVLLKPSKEMEITGHKIRTVWRAVHNLSAINTITSHKYSGSIKLSYLHLLGPLKKHLASQRLATDGNMKSAVTLWLQALHTISSMARYKPWCHSGINT
jgi:hypothetical protein